jgi:four helix bundle protein
MAWTFLHEREGSVASTVAPETQDSRSSRWVVNEMSTHHHDLAAWKAAIALATGVYEATAHLPSEETFGLAQELRRCAVNVPTAIADGAARNRPLEFIAALRAARASLAELETHLVIAQRRHAIAESAILLTGTAQLHQTLGALIRVLSERRSPVPYVPLSSAAAHR